MNGFIYEEAKKSIQITDGTTIVVWENVEKVVAEEAGKLYKEKKDIDIFLTQHNCKRFRGNKAPE